MVWPASAVLTTYVFCVAPAMFTQDAPLVLQRRHWYWNAVGLPVHVPFSAVSVSPTFAVPLIVGGAVFAGNAATADVTPTASMLEAVAARMEIRLIVMGLPFTRVRVPRRSTDVCLKS
jgi:hypothetical protein